MGRRDTRLAHHGRTPWLPLVQTRDKALAMTAVLILAIALTACAATMIGGLLALKLSSKLPLVMGFSAGAVIGVAFFDLAPEALEAGKGLNHGRA